MPGNTRTETIQIAEGVPTGAIAKAKPGYQFAGWYKVKAGTETADTLIVNPTESNQEVAELRKDTVAEYKLNRDAADQTITDTAYIAVFVANNQAFTTVSYDFEIVDNKGNVVENPGPMTSLTPGPQMIQIINGTVLERGNDGKLSPAAGAKIGSTAAEIPGYTFEGWFKSEDETRANELTGNKNLALVLEGKQTLDTVLNHSDGETGPYTATTLIARFREEKDVTLSYQAMPVDGNEAGKVNPATNSVAPASGTATGSTATANLGYHFVKWTAQKAAGQEEDVYVETQKDVTEHKITTDKVDSHAKAENL